MSSNWTPDLFWGLNSYKDIIAQTSYSNIGVSPQGSYSRISSNSSKISKLAQSSYSKQQGSTVSGSGKSLIGNLAHSTYRMQQEGSTVSGYGKSLIRNLAHSTYRMQQEGSTVSGYGKSLIGNLAHSTYRMQEGSTVTSSSNSLIGKLARSSYIT